MDRGPTFIEKILKKRFTDMSEKQLIDVKFMITAVLDIAFVLLFFLLDRARSIYRPFLFYAVARRLWKWPFLPASSPV